MGRRKKAIIISSLIILSLFLMITVITPTSFIPTIPGTSTYSPTIGAKADGGNSYVYWWNVDFHYRQSFIVDNSLSPIDVVNRPIDVFLAFNPNTCYNNSIRVQYWNGTSWLPDPIPSQVWNETYYPSTSYYQSLTLTFYVNVSHNSVATYYIYYDNENQGVPSYPAQVTSNYTSGTYTITGDYYTASINATQNGGKVYVSTDRVSGNEWSYDQQMDWSPEYAYGRSFFFFTRWTYYDTSGHPANSVANLEQGPLFVMFNITMNMSSGSDVAGVTNIIYRFYSWGWTTETSTNFTRSFTYSSSRRAEYHGNELRFDTRIMPEMEYEDVDGAVYHISNFAWNGNNTGKAHWICFWDPNDGEGAGTIDLELPSASKAPYNWYYLVSAPTSGAEKWQRVWPSVTYNSGDWVHENYATYIWNGKSGSTPFENFANSTSSAITLSIGNEENVRYTVNVQVQDYDNMPLSNANISVYKGATLNDSTTTNSAGNATLYLYGDTFNLTTTWNETFEDVTGTIIVWKTYTNTTTIVVNKTLHNALISVKFNNLTSLYAHLVSGTNDFPSANMSLYQGSSPVNINDSQKSNDTGWAVFHVDRANYNISVTYAGSSVTIDQTSVDLTSGTQTITINCTISGTPTAIYTNSTLVESVWGDDVNITIYWRDNNGVNLSTDTVGGYVNYTLFNATNKSVIPGYENRMLPPQGTAPNTYYVINLPYTVLYGDQYYTVYVRAEDNSSTYLFAEKEIVLHVKPANANVDYVSILGPFWWGQSDIPMNIHMTYNGGPVTNATIGYSMISLTGMLKFSGLLTLITGSDGYYFSAIPRTDISNTSNGVNVGVYTLSFSIRCTNFTSVNLERSISISPANTTLSWSAFPSNEGFSGLNITFTVLYNDSINGNIISDAYASISYQVLNTSVGGSFVYDASLGYQANISSSDLEIGVYVMSITARGDNYEPQSVYVPIIIKAIPTELLTSSVYLSDLAAPNIIYLGQFIQVENNMPFVIINIKYDAPSHSPVPGATVTVNGINMIYTGDGNYMALIPTYGLPPGAYPLFVTAEGSGYSQQNLIFLVSVKERSVLIPFVNARVPLTTFVAVMFSVLIMVGLFLGYAYVQRARIPAMIRRIDQLIAAMNRGERVDVRLIPREEVISRILAEEMSIIGVEPRIKGYVPLELADRLVPLLVESGMKEKEAYNLAVELKKATPSDREKLLASVGVPGEISERVIQTIEKYEEMSKVPSTKPKPAKTRKETEEAPPKEAQPEEPTEETRETPSSESEEPEKPSGENDEESGK